MRRQLPRLLLLCVAGAAMASLGGCYEHVVRTSGFGSDRINTYEGRPNTDADQWFDENILGKEPVQTKPMELSSPPPQ